MRSTKKDIDLHRGRLTGGATSSEQAESIEFFARLANDDKLPKHIDPQLADAFISTAKDKRRLQAVRANALNILVKMLERPSAHTHTLVDKGIIRVLAEVIVDNSDELRAASALAARHIADCCGDCKTKLIETGVDSGSQQQIDDSISTAKDKRRALAVRANAVKILEKLLERRSRSLTHVLVEKGIVGVLSEMIVGRSNKLRAASVQAARLIADCCRKCRTNLCQAGVDTGTMQQLIAGGFDSSAEATRGAVSLVVTNIWIGQIYRIDKTVVRDLVFPALARSLTRLGDDNAEKVVLDALRSSGNYDMMARHTELIDYLTSAIATASVTTNAYFKREFSRVAFELMVGIMPVATRVQLRSVVHHTGFMLNLSRLVLFEDFRGTDAERILYHIACAPVDVFADFVLENTALITALAAPIWPFEGYRGLGAVLIIMKILHATTAGGPTTQSQFLLGFGFLPRFVRYINFCARYRDTHETTTILDATRTALYAVLAAHPEWTRQLHEAGASEAPLQVAIQLRAARQPQQYIIYDEDCETI